MREIEEIRKIRKRLGLTQVELAQKSGVSQSLIAKIEAGRLDPTYTKTKKIFDILNTLSQKNSAKARDVMNKRIISARPEQKVKAIIQKMKQYGISQVPVLEGRTPVGLVTEGLLLEKMARGDIRELQACEVMEECPPIVSENTDIDAVSLLLRHFPVVLVAEKGQPKGLITKSDLIEKYIK